MSRKRKVKKGEENAPALPEVHILNGPNLNMLGLREPEIYGTETLQDLEEKLMSAVMESQMLVKLVFFQTNHEGEMIDYIQSLVIEVATKGNLAGVILNPAGWTHTSIALRDAVLLLYPVPLVEVHLSNPALREDFRHFSFFEDIASHRVIGQGQQGYVEALQWLLEESSKDRPDLH